jgi:hypothetical protein
MTVTDAQVTPFDVGRVLSRTGALVRKNFVPFLALSAILAGVPYFLMLSVPSTFSADPNSAALVTIAAALVLIAAGVVLQAAITRVSIDDLSGNSVSIGAALSTGVAVALPLFGLTMLYGLGVFFGLLLLVVPGIFLALRWAVSGPVLVVERLGVFKAMERSAKLTENHRWAILGLLVLYSVLVFGLQFVIGLIVPSAGDVMMGRPSDGSLVSITIPVVLQTFWSIVGTAGVASVYFELRQTKDGIAVTELAHVFA